MIKKSMIAVIGSREVTLQMREDIRKIVRKLLKKDKSVVTGGAWGTDFEVVKTVFENDKLDQLFVILPQGIRGQYSYYQEKGNSIAAEQIRLLFTKIRKQRSQVFQVVEEKYNPRTYGQCCLKRNALIIQKVSRCYAFQKMNSASENNPARPSGTQYMLSLARSHGIEVSLRQYR